MTFWLKNVSVISHKDAVAVFLSLVPFSSGWRWCVTKSLLTLTPWFIPNKLAAGAEASWAAADSSPQNVQDLQHIFSDTTQKNHSLVPLYMTESWTLRLVLFKP